MSDSKDDSKVELDAKPASPFEPTFPPPDTKPTSKRLFVGARVSVATANALAGAAETLARRARDVGVDIRWVAPVNYHVTVKFLGHTREAAIAAVADALHAATQNTQRITFRTTRLGGFPSLDKANVLWAGVEETGGVLTELAKRVDASCERLGYAIERRPFHAHVTLGRTREFRAIRDVVLPLAEQMFGDTRIDAITLFESETKPSGSVYRELHRIDFTSNAPAAAERPPAETEDTDDGWPRGHVPE